MIVPHLVHAHTHSLCVTESPESSLSLDSCWHGGVAPFFVQVSDCRGNTHTKQKQKKHALQSTHANEISETRITHEIWCNKSTNRTARNKATRPLTNANIVLVLETKMEYELEQVQAWSEFGHKPCFDSLVSHPRGWRLNFSHAKRNQRPLDSRS